MAVSISLSIKQNSQSVANNTSNVTVTCTASWTNGSWNKTGKCTGSITIDGTKYSFSGLTFNDGETTTGSKNIMTKTVDVNHGSDGTKKLSCSASFVTGVNSGTVTASASKTLTTIPRKSTLSVGNGTLETSQTLSVTRQSSSFTHSIKAVCGSSTLYIKADGSTSSSEAKHSDCSIPFKPPASWASQNTTNTSVSVTYTITTYNGSTKIGYNSYDKTCTIPNSAAFCPSCSISVTDDTGHADTYGGYIKGVSKFKVNVTTKPAYGASIKAYRVTANGASYTKASFTTDVLKSSGTLTISSTVTDARKRTGSTSKNITVLDYSAPKLTALSVHRCDEDGTPNDQNGENIQVNFSSDITSLSGKNTASYTLEYKKSSESTYTSVKLTDYDNNYSVTNGSYIIKNADSGSSYNVRIIATDNFGTGSRTTTASTGFTIMHWLASGLGMAIGKIAELTNVLDIGFQTRFMGGILHPVLEPKTNLDDVRTPNTYVGANVSDYEYVNCPLESGTFTLEVVGMGDEGQVKQKIIYCHKTESRTWERIYYGSLWGEWFCVSDFGGTLLAWPGLYMTDGHTVNLLEPISKQKNGIVLIFSRYDAEAEVVVNESFSAHFIPKKIVSLYPGRGFNFNLNGMFANGMKYLYIHDTQIVGHSNNNLTDKTLGGITYNNRYYVLRYVIGV